jgi:N-formylglutamate amidohydrolase
MGWLNTDKKEEEKVQTEAEQVKIPAFEYVQTPTAAPKETLEGLVQDARTAVRRVITAANELLNKIG